MLRSKLFVACAVAILVSLPLGMAAAQDSNPNQRTYFTFSQSVELPGGTVLPAGRYLFRIVDSPSNRHTIQILSDDESKVHATLLAIPAQRRDPSDDPEVRFMETVANAPAAIRTWWYPGRTIGHEFIYPKDQARRLAAGQREGILTASGATVDEMRTADLTRIDAAGAETRWPSEAVAEVSPEATTQTPAPTTRDTTVTRETTAREAATARDTTTTTETTMARTTRTELPRTASFLPLLALIGMGSLAGAATLRYRRR